MTLSPITHKAEYTFTRQANVLRADIKVGSLADTHTGGIRVQRRDI